MAHSTNTSRKSSPWHYSWAEWRKVLGQTWHQTQEDHIDLLSAGVAFYGFLALVPMLGAIVLIYGLLATPQSVLDLFRQLTTVMPTDAAGLVRAQLMNVVSTSGSKKGFGLALALVLALYGARSGTGAIITALNLAYEERETRSFVRFNLIAVGITLTVVVVALLGSGAAAVAALLEHWLPAASPGLIAAERAGSWLLLMLAAATVAGALYWIGPDRKMRKWSWLTPGAALVGIGWTLATVGFGAFVANFGRYNATYGSLAAVIVILTWFYLSSFILLIGAELNAECERQANLLEPDPAPDASPARANAPAAP